MKNASNDINQLFHERWLDFTYSFGNDGFFENGVERSMRAIAEICAIFFGEEHAAAGLNKMVRGPFPNWKESDKWDHILEEEFTSIHAETAIGQLLHDLTAYANFGIVVAPARDARQRETLLANQLETAERLLQLLPTDLWDLESEHLVTLVQKALARWKLDCGQYVNATELALLSGKALQTIKNKLAGKPAEIVGNQNRIDAREALGWLQTLRDFKPSIWREQDDSEALATIDRGLAEVLFLPVAKDGSVFHPGVQRDGKYLIDGEGVEREVNDFAEALQNLQLMTFPQWRRPTPEGVWTRVRATEWRRYSADEIEMMSAAS
ncbi:hypothetical protein FGK63_08685 [Ruegeria sediminis]|uniref:DUF2913 family protein n=1 Tax=Ruegeria sediminis TaxID=2583820 RepID=A0ABY2WY86_9RHOB|nr:hypothetical protein [Ruegeria sediminis]TMV07538.1 hypothetical protein FGK63_08685 [Ruegeria sediminis]